MLLGPAELGEGRGALLGEGGDTAGAGGARVSVLTATSVAISGPMLLTLIVQLIYPKQASNPQFLHLDIRRRNSSKTQNRVSIDACEGR